MLEEKDCKKESSLAYLLVAEQGRSNKRLCIINMILILLLFASYMAWLYQWTQYDYVSETTTVTVDSGNSGTGDAIYNEGQGAIINGEGYCNEDKAN